MISEFAHFFSYFFLFLSIYVKSSIVNNRLPIFLDIKWIYKLNKLEGRT